VIRLKSYRNRTSVTAWGWDCMGIFNHSWYPVFEWDQSETIFGNFSSRPNQLRTKVSKKNFRMAVVSMRSAGGRVQEPASPQLQFRYPHCVPILVTMVLDRSHNLRMVREGRTNVTILVSADRQSSASGKCLPGPAVCTGRECSRDTVTVQHTLLSFYGAW
jgi:hypothetical protein